MTLRRDNSSLEQILIYYSCIIVNIKFIYRHRMYVFASITTTRLYQNPVYHCDNEISILIVPNC